jgi:DNA ligase (NAD+)
VSRGALDIDRLGPVVLAELLTRQRVRVPADLFRLTEADLRDIPGQGDRSSRQLVAAIQARRRPSLGRFLYALGIRHIGERTAELLAEHFGTLDQLRAASVEQLAAVNGVGPVLAESVHRFLHSPGGEELIDQLLAAGVEPQGMTRVEGPWRGLTVVLTGSLSRLTRSQAEAEIKRRGGTAGSSVSRKTSAVVAGAAPGSKLATAERLGVPVLDEEQFQRWLAEPTLTPADLVAAEAPAG